MYHNKSRHTRIGNERYFRSLFNRGDVIICRSLNDHLSDGLENKGKTFQSLGDCYLRHIVCIVEISLLLHASNEMIERSL